MKKCTGLLLVKNLWKKQPSLPELPERYFLSLWSLVPSGDTQCLVLVGLSKVSWLCWETCHQEDSMGLIKGNMPAVPFCYHRPIGLMGQSVVSCSGISFGDQVEMKAAVQRPHIWEGGTLLAQMSILLILQSATSMCSWWSPAQVTAASKWWMSHVLGATRKVTQTRIAATFQKRCWFSWRVLLLGKQRTDGLM